MYLYLVEANLFENGPEARKCRKCQKHKEETVTRIAQKNVVELLPFPNFYVTKPHFYVHYEDFVIFQIFPNFSNNFL